MAAQRSYEERAANHPNACAKSLLDTIVRKQSNLCVSVDVTRKADLLDIVDAVGPYVALIKVRAVGVADNRRTLTLSRTLTGTSSSGFLSLA